PLLTATWKFRNDQLAGSDQGEARNSAWVLKAPVIITYTGSSAIAVAISKTSWRDPRSRTCTARFPARPPAGAVPDGAGITRAIGPPSRARRPARTAGVLNPETWTGARAPGRGCPARPRTPRPAR